MAFGPRTILNFGQGVADLFGPNATAEGLRIKAHGDLSEALNFDLASDLAKQNALFEKASTGIKEMQTQRQTYLGLGQETADIAGAGFSMSGTGLDLLRSGVEQGALTKQVVTAQGQIKEAGYKEQSAAYTNMAEAARQAAQEEQSLADKSSFWGKIGGGFKLVSSIASLFF